MIIRVIFTPKTKSPKFAKILLSKDLKTHYKTITASDHDIMFC